jgi:ketosteroid isomerase-like protein
LQLEQENESLRQQLATGNTEAYDKLIDLLAPDIEWWEKNLVEKTSQKMKSIVAAYRAVRPK